MASPAGARPPLAVAREPELLLARPLGPGQADLRGGNDLQRHAVRIEGRPQLLAPGRQLLGADHRVVAAEVGGGGHDPYAVRECRVSELDRFLGGPGAIVDAGQEMAVQVDHR